jgi:hypothetical protein
VSDELADLLSEECRLSILQGRFEALHQAAPSVGPEHIVLGVLKRLPESQFAQLFPEPDAFDHLCALLSASAAPAPVSPADIGYAPGSYALVAAAAAAAGGVPTEGSVQPLHLLLGAHALPGEHASNPIAAQLTQMEITRERLQRLLQPEPPGDPTAPTPRD